MASQLPLSVGILEKVLWNIASLAADPTLISLYNSAKDVIDREVSKAALKLVKEAPAPASSSVSEIYEESAQVEKDFLDIIRGPALQRVPSRATVG